MRLVWSIIFGKFVTIFQNKNMRRQSNSTSLKLKNSKAYPDNYLENKRSEPKRIYSEHDAVVLKSIVDASKFGLEPRHLRGMRLAVDREVGLVSQAVSASRSASKKMSKDEFRDKGRELSDILSTLRQVLTRDAINKLES